MQLMTLLSQEATASLKPLKGSMLIFVFLAGWPHCCQKCKSHYIRFDGYIIELETTQRQCLNAEKVQQYAVYLLLEIVHKY